MLAALILAGTCTSLTAHAESTGLTHARRFNDFRLYYAGPRLRNAMLTEVVEHAASARHRASWSFIYGDCTPDPSQDDAGCTPPYELRNFSICERNPHRYDRFLKPRRLHDIRGAAVYRYEGDGLSIDVYTGHTAIVIFAPSERDALRAAHSLRSVDGRFGPRDRLAPPTRRALQGRAHCRR